MTTYDILFGEIPAMPDFSREVPSVAVSRIGITHGARTGGYMLVWLHGGGSGGGALRFDGDGSHLHGSYIMEKMDILPGDANAILGFLKSQGLPVRLPSDQWGDDGFYYPSRTHVNA